MTTTYGIRNFNNIIDFLDYFKDEQTCREYLEEIRWNKNPFCPHCGNMEVFRYKDGRLFKCKACRQQFTIKVGTIFEDSKIPLQKWFLAIFIVTAHKKGISSVQLSHDIAVTQKTAWFMLQRIRYALNRRADAGKMDGTVEVDESFFGGQDKFKHKSKKLAREGKSDKTIIMGLIQRDGRVITEKIPSVHSWILQPIVRKYVKINSTVVTDSFRGYDGLHVGYDHGVVKHMFGEYVRGNYHTNTLEGFWSLVRRGFYGIYHSISDKHITKYLDEFSFRYDLRNRSQVERFGNMLLLSDNKRLTYKELIAN